MRPLSTVLILISFFLVKFARAQSPELLVHGQTGKLYLEHIVVAKENWYSVGRLYNISPKELAPFNKLALTQPLTIGETLEIPLTAANFSQDGKKTATETMVPVYHVIQEKEWMYRISVNHNKVPIPSLEKWNNVNKDQVHPGMHLIVGYLKVKTALSALAAGSGATSVAKGEVPAVKSQAAISQAEDSSVEEATEKKPATADAAEKKPATADAAEKKPVVTDAPEKRPAATQTTPVKQVSAAIKTDSPADAATGKQSAATTTPKQPAASTTGMPPAALRFNGGAFRNEYSESGKSASGQAGTFKSTSGWQDGKYYALMNNTPVGTIVKISDASTGKSVYVKILGQLPDMKESAGLAIRISNAAAAELGEGEGRFTVSINY